MGKKEVDDLHGLLPLWIPQISKRGGFIWAGFCNLFYTHGKNAQSFFLVSIFILKSKAGKNAENVAPPPKNIKTRCMDTI